MISKTILGYYTNVIIYNNLLIIKTIINKSYLLKTFVKIIVKYK